MVELHDSPLVRVAVGCVESSETVNQIVHHHVEQKIAQEGLEYRALPDSMLNKIKLNAMKWEVSFDCQHNDDKINLK